MAEQLPGCELRTEALGLNPGSSATFVSSSLSRSLYVLEAENTLLFMVLTYRMHNKREFHAVKPGLQLATQTQSTQNCKSSRHSFTCVGPQLLTRDLQILTNKHLPENEIKTGGPLTRDFPGFFSSLLSWLSPGGYFCYNGKHFGPV